ncbi:MAG TPA: Lrp/AsnC family transcriptional regulator [Phototrophicaceae bacterium]|nr:Lrp/AsnC family transcriptional regulator [Phototrophicaceae bacterium]
MKDFSLEIDDTDKAILTELQKDSSISNVELARRISLSPPAVHARIKRLEELGYVRQYAAILDREKVGYDLLCLVQVTLEVHHMQNINVFRDAINQMPEVLECYFITGEFDYLLKVAVRSRKELERFLMEKLTPVPGIARIATSIVLTEVKFTTSLSLETPPDDEE